ncbi:MAG: sigma-70 family RNA polymerase sigma factor [Bacteroidetes bacterium]|nr:MAG: sigma-70 family RNA polymerase sigma factor [Bacteroidota bacterium]
MRESDFLDLIESQSARLRRLVQFYAPDASSQADLQQEILYQLWRSRHQFEGRAQASTWLYRVALNTALSFRRGWFRRAKRRGNSPPERLASPPEAEIALERQEQLAALRAAIAQLKPLEQDLVLLYLEDVSYAGMAEITGLSVSHVGVKLNRIKKRLANHLRHV